MVWNMRKLNPIAADKKTNAETTVPSMTTLSIHRIMIWIRNNSTAKPKK
jgi:hypothetical protein